MKAKLVVDSDGRYYGIRTRCRYCYAHVLPTDWTPPGMERSPHVVGLAQWHFDGNLESPTFSPSVLSRIGPLTDAGAVEHYRARGHNVQIGGQTVCHSFIRGGKIEYLGDCTHPLAGHTIELDEIGENPDAD
jgi:hypothetical protein